MNTTGLHIVKYFLLGFVLMLLVFGGVTFLLTQQGVEIDSSLVYLLFAFQQLLTLLVVYASFRAGGYQSLDDVMMYFSQRSTRKGRGLFRKRVMGGFVVYMIGNGLLYSVLEYFSLEVPGLYGDQGVMTMLQEMNITGVVEWVMIVLMVVVIAPIIEELVYRGLITDTFMQRRRWWGVVAGAFIFALIHLEFAVFWNLFLLAFILGVIYYKTQSMRYSFLFHVLINGMGIAALWVETSGYL